MDNINYIATTKLVTINIGIDKSFNYPICYFVSLK